MLLTKVYLEVIEIAHPQKLKPGIFWYGFSKKDNVFRCFWNSGGGLATMLHETVYEDQAALYVQLKIEKVNEGQKIIWKNKNAILDNYSQSIPQE